MEELEALLKDLESSGTPRDPPGVPNLPQKCPQPPPGTPPGPRGQGPGGDPEQLYSSVWKPRPPRGSPPPPGLAELERLLRELKVTPSSATDEILAQTPEDEPKIGEPPPPTDSGTPPGPPKFGVEAPKSVAMQELDRLLASLADFHLQHPKAPPEPPPPAQELQELLQQLQEELRGRGGPRGARGGCEGCGKPILGQALRALGGSWHPQHFVCSACGAPLLGAVVTALGRTWHPEHFCCAHCGDVLGDEGFLEKDGRPFCRRDFGALFGERCRGCRGPVLEAFVAALGGLWHPECFVCQECQAPFPGGSFFQLEGVPLCQRHFQERGNEQGWGRG